MLVGLKLAVAICGKEEQRHSLTGDALLLDLKDGSVWFFDPQDVTDEPNQNLRQYMHRLSSSFDEFVAKLISEAEEEVLRAGDPVYEEFKQRLERFKRERKQERVTLIELAPVSGPWQLVK